MRKYTKRLEASVTHSILTQLGNLGWVVDEKDADCNVTQQRPRTEAERRKLRGNLPDFVLYQKDTNKAIGVIEAKRPGESLAKAIDDAERKYAKPLETPLIFAYNDTYVATRYLGNGRSLKIDGEDVRQFVDHYTAIQFVNQGPEIFAVPPHIQYSREQLIAIFRRAADLLREAGLQAGLERFGAFSDILFLKLMDERCALCAHWHPHHLWRRSLRIPREVDTLELLQTTVLLRSHIHEARGKLWSENPPYNGGIKG